MLRVELDEITNAKLGRLEVILREPNQQIVERALADYLVNGEGAYLLAVIRTPTINGFHACTIDDVIRRMDVIYDLVGKMTDAEDGVEVAFHERELTSDLKPQLAFLPKTLPEIAAQVLGNSTAILDDIMGFISQRCGMPVEAVMVLGNSTAILDDIMGFISQRCGMPVEAVMRRAVNWHLTLGGGGSILSKPDTSSSP